MRPHVLFVMSAFIVACASAPSYQYFEGGDRVDQPGVSFILPTGHKWAAVMRSTYQSAFGALGMPKDDTLLVASAVYNLRPFSSKEDFLKQVHEGRAREPQTGRFELIRNQEQIDESRADLCVRYSSASKDFGVKAKRGGDYSVLETMGVHCVHPKKPNVGIHVEFSRKAPPGKVYPRFEMEGSTLLQSLTFHEF